MVGGFEWRMGLVMLIPSTHFVNGLDFANPVAGKKSVVANPMSHGIGLGFLVLGQGSRLVLELLSIFLPIYRQM